MATAALSTAAPLPPELAGRAKTTLAPVGLFQIELTNRCPMRCVMCPRTEHMTRPHGDMEVALFTQIVAEYARVNPERAAVRPVWLHHFGESLLHPAFDRCLTIAREHGVAAGLSVNPLMLTDATRERLLAARPAKLLCSLDGHDDASFEAIRGLPRAWERSREQLLAFVRRKAELGVETELVVSMIDFGRNRESIERTRAFWSSQPGVDAFLAKPFTTWDGSAGDIRALADGPGQGAVAGGPSWVHCDFPWDAMVVTWDGDVVPCCFDYDKKQPLGSLREQSLVEIWNGPAMQALRSEFLDNRVVNPLCRACENRRFG